VNKSKRSRLAGIIARLWLKRFLIEKSEGKKYVGNLNRDGRIILKWRWENNIKMEMVE